MNLGKPLAARMKARLAQGDWKRYWSFPKSFEGLQYSTLRNSDSRVILSDNRNL